MQAFTLLMTKLTSAPLLVYPNFEEAFIVDCDASDDGLGAVLSQNHQGAEHVVYYASMQNPNISIVPHEKRCWH